MREGHNSCCRSSVSTSQEGKLSKTGTKLRPGNFRKPQLSNWIGVSAINPSQSTCVCREQGERKKENNHQPSRCNGLGRDLKSIGKIDFFGCCQDVLQKKISWGCKGESFCSCWCGWFFMCIPSQSCSQPVGQIQPHFTKKQRSPKMPAGLEEGDQCWHRAMPCTQPPPEWPQTGSCIQRCHNFAGKWVNERKTKISSPQMPNK